MTQQLGASPTIVILMTPQLRASPTIIILKTLDVSLMLLELSVMLLENTYSTGITHDHRHFWLSYFCSTGHLALPAIIRLSWKILFATNGLTYFAEASLTKADGFKTAILTVKGVTFKYTLRVQFYCPYLRCILAAFKFTLVPENALKCNFNCKGHLHVRFQRPISH